MTTAAEPGEEATEGRILVEGETCWRIARAERAAVLVDGEACFGAIAAALERARHAIWLVGWDFHSRVRLRHDDGGSHPSELVALLEALVRERRGLRVRMLGWDFALLYALERQILPQIRFGTSTHPRIDFELAASPAFTGSHHQKIVVVDDALGFCGGFDLTTHRWDTRAHAPGDPRRVNPDGSAYGPFHDVHMAVDGRAAAALADLARARWLEATGERVRPMKCATDPWPETLAVDLRDVDVGIARTSPSGPDGQETREVEALFLRSIAAARHSIYVENQYLTSDRVGRALEQSLSRERGPDVVIVGPERASGWLEERTMGALRGRLVRRLREADAGRGRLRVLYPWIPDLPTEQWVNVHAKVMVVDDVFLRVGSANLSNRSMGLDSECDLAVEAPDDATARAAIAAVRDDLLAEHLGVERQHVAEALRETGSLAATVDRLSGEGRTLRPLEDVAPEWAAAVADEIGVADPEYPMPLDELVGRFTDESRPTRARRVHVARALGLAAALIALAALWRFTPLSEWVEPGRLGSLAEPLRSRWWGPPTAAGLFAVASLLMVPVTGLILAAGVVLGPTIGFAVSLAGSIGSAVAAYAIGRAFWREGVRRLAGRRLNALSRRLGRRGILSTALVRIAPVAPFTVVNLVAGASHVGLRDFTLGTFLGMTPGIIALTFAADRVVAALRDPSAAGVALALAASLAAAALLWWLRGVASRRGVTPDP